MQPYAAAFGTALGDLRSTLKRLWRLPWENCRKEPFWRLIYDAFPTAARMHLPDPCICGGAPADRQHHFWDCPVARSVVGAISAALHGQPAATAAAAAGGAPPALPQRSIWLAAPPPAVHEGVWSVVCLAAVEAMDHGRRRMYAMQQCCRPSPRRLDCCHLLPLRCRTFLVPPRRLCRLAMCPCRLALCTAPQATPSFSSTKPLAASPLPSLLHSPTPCPLRDPPSPLPRPADPAL